jgi:hypothetical protein
MFAALRFHYASDEELQSAANELGRAVCYVRISGLAREGASIAIALDPIAKSPIRMLFEKDATMWTGRIVSAWID